MEIGALATYIFFFLSLYFEVFLLITFFERKEELGAEESVSVARVGTNLALVPTVTVIVPCYNEEKTIAPTVQSLLNVSYPKPIKIIVVDDGSTDGTGKALAPFRALHNVEIIHKQNGGKASALNAGLSRVNTDLVACLDADSFVDPNTLLRMVHYFEDSNVMAVTPAMRVYQPRTLLEHVQSAEYHLGIFLRKMFSFLDAQFVTPGPFSLYRASLFPLVGGFHPAHNTEDLEMALRIQERHYKIKNAHTARVYTIAPKRFIPLFRQRIRWTYGFMKNVWDYRKMLLRPKYGNLGFAVLPFALFSIIAAVYFALFALANVAQFILEKIVEVSAVGFSAPNITPDWFFVGTEGLALLGYTLIAATILLIAISRKVSHGAYTLRAREIWYYLVLYGIIAPLWLGKAVLDVALNRQNKWK